MTGESLIQLYLSHRGKVAHKWHAFLSAYERALSGLRNEEIRPLEMGVQNGGALEIWARYFPATRCIVGCDSNPKCKDPDFDDARITVVVGDANSAETRDQIARVSQRLGIIIDNGSHRSSDVIESFLTYFVRAAEGGLQQSRSWRLTSPLQRA